MDRKQRTVLCVGAVLMALALLFPPYHYCGANGISAGAGHSFLLSDPTGGPPAAKIDPNAWAITMLGVAVVTAIAWFAFYQRREPIINRVRIRRESVGGKMQ